MVECIKYDSSRKDDWNSFILASRAPLFFFERDFLEYHKYRFKDNSLMFFDNNELIAVLPASISESDGDKELVSHGGLTFGGLILAERLRGTKVQLILKSLESYCQLEEIKTVFFKVVPYIFHTLSSQEELYFLFNFHNSRLIKRELSTVIYLKNKLKSSKGRKALVSKARKSDINIQDTDDFESFHMLLTSVLSKHGVKPTHSLSELIYLKNLYPKNIRLVAAFKNENMISAALIFVFNNVAHTQYLANSDMGRISGALDLLIDECIDYYKEMNFNYFSFGISTEQSGIILNEGLLSQKESFGGRSIVLDTYQVKF